MEQLKFLASHEWARLEADGTVTVGISDHAQEALGELVYVELPEVDDHFDSGSECAVVESVKAASDVYCPVAGTIQSINSALEENPELVNQSPQDEGWLFKLKPDNVDDLDQLLDQPAYQATLDQN